MFLFFSLCRSAFVSYSLVNFDVLPSLSLDEVLESSVSIEQYVVGFYLNNQSRSFSSKKQAILSAYMFFGESSSFSMIELEKKEDFDQELSISDSLVFFIRNGNILKVFPFPVESGFLFPLIDKNINSKTTIIENKDQLFSSIVESSFALLCLEESLSSAFSLQVAASSTMGSVEILVCSHGLFKELGIEDNYSLAVFRFEDMIIQPINNSEDSLFYHSYPLYRMLSMDDLLDNDPTVFAFVSNEIGPLEREFLFNMSSEYPEFIFGWAHPSIGRAMHEIYPFRPTKNNVAFVSMANRGYYNISSFFSYDMLKEPLNISKWVQLASYCCDMVLNGSMTLSFMSEPVPENTNPLKKVVGMTYSNFIHNTSKDIMMLYMKENCHHCHTFMETFSEIANEFANNSIDSIMFGYIDVKKNSCEEKYPYFSGVPHIVYYSKTGENFTHRGSREKENIIRYIVNHSSEHIHVALKPINEEEITLEVLRLMMLMDRVSPIERQSYSDYIEEQMDLLNSMKKPEDTTQINDEQSSVRNETNEEL